MAYDSDDKATEALVAGQITPPEIDNYQEDEDFRSLMSIYESSSISIIGKMDTSDFYEVYNVLKNDIMAMSDHLRHVFIDKYLEQMVKIYEFEFQFTPTYGTKDKIENMFKFIEFVE